MSMSIWAYEHFFGNKIDADFLILLFLKEFVSIFSLKWLPFDMISVLRSNCDAKLRQSLEGSLEMLKI